MVWVMVITVFPIIGQRLGVRGRREDPAGCKMVRNKGTVLGNECDIYSICFVFSGTRVVFCVVIPRLYLLCLLCYDRAESYVA